jgi:GTP cyclohydrolase I
MSALYWNNESCDDQQSTILQVQKMQSHNEGSVWYISGGDNNMKHEEQCSEAQIEKLRDILTGVGIDLNEEGFKRTPVRFLAVLYRFTEGYNMKVTLDRTYSHGCSMVIEKDIPFVSLCEHHLMPFYGTVTIAYIPEKKKVTGLSKLDELVLKHSLRFQIQERMAKEIADALEAAIQPKGTAVIISAVHTCKLVEGFQATNYIVSEVRGVFLTEPHAKQELVSLLAAYQ